MQVEWYSRGVHGARVSKTLIICPRIPNKMRNKEEFNQIFFVLCSKEQQNADNDKSLPPKGYVLCLCLLKQELVFVLC
jgi:hypothetical protein